MKKGVSLCEHLQHLQTTYTIPILQYRNKNGSLQEKKEALLKIRTYYDGILIVNDSIELIDYADGLHVGQEDIRAYAKTPSQAIKEIRNQIGSKLLGLSTHNKEEILEANQLSLDYVGLGAFRPTQTKSNVSITGKLLLAIAKSSRHPVGLIGGIKCSDSFESHIAYKVIGSDLFK